MTICDMRDVDRRDARPFLAHHLRECADLRMDTNGADLHALARWVENLPADDHRIVRVAICAELDYSNGTFKGGVASESLIDSYQPGDDAGARNRWLELFAVAVAEAKPRCSPDRG